MATDQYAENATFKKDYTDQDTNIKVKKGETLQVIIHDEKEIRCLTNDGREISVPHDVIKIE